MSVIQIQIDASSLEKVVRFPEFFLRAIARGMNTANELVLGHATTTRFRGKGPYPVAENRLGVRSHRLVESLRRSDAVISGVEIRSSMGSNVKYFAAHEFGFSGTVTVKQHSRKVASRDQVRIGPRGGKKQVASGVGTVRSFSRKMNIPARAPLTTAIRESTAIYQDEISAAINAELEAL